MSALLFWKCVRNHSMGNPTSGLTVQTTMSVSKGRHRQSRSVASLQLEKLSQQESRCNSHEKMSTGTFSPRATEENSIASFLGDKKMKRRTRSSLGGSDEFVKGLELHGLALLTEEKKPMSFNPFKGFSNFLCFLIDKIPAVDIHSTLENKHILVCGHDQLKGNGLTFTSVQEHQHFIFSFQYAATSLLISERA